MNTNNNIYNNGHYIIAGARLTKIQKEALTKRGFYVNDMRTWDDYEGSTIEPFVLVNHEGTFITNVPILWDAEENGRKYVKDSYEYVEKHDLDEFDYESEDYKTIISIVDESDLNLG